MTNSVFYFNLHHVLALIKVDANCIELLYGVTKFLMKLDCSRSRLMCFLSFKIFESFYSKIVSSEIFLVTYFVF